MWLLLLAACHGPSETGEHGIVGRLLDAAGAPLAGVKIESIEAEGRTDGEGHFAVAWKPPGTHVYFQRGTTVFHRSLQPDDPEEVELRLPELHLLTVRCPEVACQLDLTWELGPGFKGTVARKCSVDEELALEGVPVGFPTATCTADGKPLGHTPLIQNKDLLKFVPPASPLRVEVRSTEGRDPAECEVVIDGLVAEAQGDSVWAGEQRGEVPVNVFCETRPAWPVTARAEAGSVAVDWNRDGPVLDVTGLVPEARAVQVLREGEPPLLVGLDDEGSFALPPVPAGTYRVLVQVDGGTEAPDAWPEPGKPGVLVLHEGAGGSRAGTVVLEEDLTTGRMPVSGP